MPKNFDDCINYGIQKFYKYYRNDVKQLIYTYPLGTMTKDGEPFWKMPKRPPTEILFDPNNEFCQVFVTSMAILRAQMFGLSTYPKDFRKPEIRK